MERSYTRWVFHTKKNNLRHTGAFHAKARISNCRSRNNNASAYELLVVSLGNNITQKSKANPILVGLTI
jgi:hypothetical protein